METKPSDNDTVRPSPLLQTVYLVQEKHYLKNTNTTGPLELSLVRTDSTYLAIIQQIILQMLFLTLVQECRLLLTVCH